MRCDRLKEEIKQCHYLHCQQKKCCMVKSFEARTAPPFKRDGREPNLSGRKRGK